MPRTNESQILKETDAETEKLKVPIKNRATTLKKHKTITIAARNRPTTSRAERIRKIPNNNNNDDDDLIEDQEANNSSLTINNKGTTNKLEQTNLNNNSSSKEEKEEAEVEEEEIETIALE